MSAAPQYIVIPTEAQRSGGICGCFSAAPDAVAFPSATTRSLFFETFLYGYGETMSFATRRMKMLRELIAYSILAASVLAVRASEQTPLSMDAIRHAIEHGDAKMTRHWLRIECPSRFETSVLFPQSADHKYAIVEAFSSSCDTMPLVLFKSADGVTWTYSDTIQLSSRYETRPDIRLVDFAQKGVSDVLVQHELVDWGTGNLQKDVSVYRLIDGRFRCVFEEPESLHFAPGGDMLPVELQSKFEVRDSAPDDVSGNKYLHEDQQINTGKQTLRRFRSCLWEQKHQHFQCVETGD